MRTAPHLLEQVGAENRRKESVVSNDTSADQVGRLFTDLESWAERLGAPGPHFAINRRPGGWLVTVFVRPIDDPEVRVSSTVDGQYGYLEARSADLDDALAGAINICQSVARDEAVPA